MAEPRETLMSRIDNLFLALVLPWLVLAIASLALVAAVALL